MLKKCSNIYLFQFKIWLLLVLEMRLIVLIEFDCVAKLVYVAISELISLSLLYNNIFNKSAFAIPTIFIVNHMIF